jgi:hypothetical protein
MSADAALYAVSGAVSVCSLALVIASRSFEGRAKQSVDRDERERTAQLRQGGLGDQGTSEPGQRPLMQVGEAPKGGSERARVTFTPTFEQTLQGLDKLPFAELAAYITRLAGNWTRGELPVTTRRLTDPRGIYTFNVRLQGQRYRVVFRPIVTLGGGPELQLLDLVAGSGLPDSYVLPEPTENWEDFDKIIASSLSPDEIAILRGAIESSE